MKKAYLVLLAVLSFSIVHSISTIDFLDFEATKKKAEAENKKIIMVFSGSDWCRPCILFEREVLSQKKFLESVDNEYVILKVDFPSMKKNRLIDSERIHNEKLAEQYNSAGEFPKILVLNASGTVLKEINYKSGTGIYSFLNHL